MSTMPFKGLIFDTDGQPMCPTFGYGHRSKVYRYYVSSNLQQGGLRSKDDDAIRRIAADDREALVLDRLQRLNPRTKMATNWASASKLLRRVHILPTALHLVLQGPVLFGAHADT
jgi:hypothetical protein